MSKVQDYLVNIKSFQMYLDNIVQSIENDRYHEDSIKRLSECISLYYSKINGDEPEDDEDIEFVDSDTSVQANDNESDDESDTSSSSSEADDTALFFSSNDKKENKKKDVKAVDKYIDEFVNENVNLNDIILYSKNKTAQDNLQNFLSYSHVF